MKSLASDVRANCRKINQLFDKFRLHFEVGDVHEFRIRMKRLNAQLFLAGVNNENNVRLVHSGALLKLYKIAGTIRGLQLQKTRMAHAIEMLPAMNPEQYMIDLKSRLKTAISRAKEIAKKGRLKHAKPATVIISKTKKGVEKRSEEFNRLTNCQLDKLLNPFFPSDQCLHALRKVLKQFLYSLPYIKKHPVRKMDYLGASSVVDIENICDKLGEFQNSCASLILLENFSPADEPRKKGKLFLLRAIWECKKEKEAARTELADLFIGKLLRHPDVTLIGAGNLSRNQQLASEENWVAQ